MVISPKNRSSVFALNLPFEDGVLQIKKRSSISTVAFESAGVERECRRKDIGFGWFGFRLQSLSSEH